MWNVVQAFTKAIQECRNIKQRRTTSWRLFWPKPALIEAVTGEQVEDLNGVKSWRENEQWIGALIDGITSNIQRALEPCETYLECFRQWEQFLNLDVEEYVSSLKHAVPNDEEYEEDQEPDAPSIQVDLGMLRKTLTSHVDAKLKIEEDIPAEAITAGACELNAFALRTELGDTLCGNQRVLAPSNAP